MGRYFTRYLGRLSRPSLTARSIMVELAGFGLAVYGLYQIWPPLGFIVGGIILVYVAQGMVAAEEGEGENGGSP